MSKTSVISDGPSSVGCVNNLWSLFKKGRKKINAKGSMLKIDKNKHQHQQQTKANSKATACCAMQYSAGVLAKSVVYSLHCVSTQC